MDNSLELWSVRRGFSLAEKQVGYEGNVKLIYVLPSASTENLMCRITSEIEFRKVFDIVSIVL